MSNKYIVKYFENNDPEGNVCTTKLEYKDILKFEKEFNVEIIEVKEVI